MPTDNNTDTKVTVSNTNPTTGTWYYPTSYTATSGTGGVMANDGLRHYSLQGTASAAGRTILQLGNATATGTAGNKYGEITNLVLSNITLKVNKDVKEGTYPLESGYNDIELIERDKFEENVIFEELPITIIDNKNTSKTLNNFIIENNYSIFGPNGVEIKLEEGKTNYEAYYYSNDSSFSYVEGSCNIKCKMTNIGTSYYEPGNKIKLKFEGDKDYKYTINITPKIMREDWITDDENHVIVVSNSDSINYFLVLKQKIDQISYDVYYYKYSNLSEDEKELLSNFGYDYTKNSEPHIYIISNKKVTNKIDGELNNNTLKEIYKLLNIDDNTSNETEEQLDANTPSFFTTIVCFLVTIITLLVIVIIFIKKK